MYIAPNTEIRLLSNVPLSYNDENTVLFDNKIEQAETFIRFTKHTLSTQSYQRVSYNTCTIERRAEDCYDCNYMMFRNTSFTNKWFYAFITDVEYYSNNVCQITYVLDDVQTWLFDFELLECMVEREHSITDNVGENILPEPVNLGEYIYDDYGKITQIFDPLAVIIGCMDTDGITGNIFDGIYSGLSYYCFKSTDDSAITQFLQAFTMTPDNVVLMYICPVILLPPSRYPRDGEAVKIDVESSGWDNVLTINTSIFNNYFGNYTPKNNKLLTYPYTYYHVDNNNGSSLSLRREFFNDNTIKLQFDSTFTSPVKITCRPYGYKTDGKNIGINTETISLSDYPYCSWKNETYNTWLMQNLLPMTYKGVVNIANSVVGGVGKSGTQRAIGVVTDVGDSLMDVYNASIQADTIRGNYQNSSVNVGHNMQNFYHCQVKITEQHARIIDEFFTMYGYACKQVKIPNINVRPEFTYTKTIGCAIKGKMPSSSIAEICRMFDRGIRFWKNINNIGKYSEINNGV